MYSLLRGGKGKALAQDIGPRHMIFVTSNSLNITERASTHLKTQSKHFHTLTHPANQSNTVVTHTDKLLLDSRWKDNGNVADISENRDVLEWLLIGDATFGVGLFMSTFFTSARFRVGDYRLQDNPFVGDVQATPLKLQNLQQLALNISQRCRCEIHNEQC